MPEDTLFDTGYELLPVEGDDIEIDTQLEAALGADPLEVEELSAVVEPEARPNPLGRGWAFDFINNRLVRRGSAPAEVNGLGQLRVWIEMTLRTARYAHEIFSDQYGMELPNGVIGRQFTPELAGKAGKAIKDALLVHDRISSVEDIRFSRDPADEVLEVSFRVIVDEYDELVVAPFVILAPGFV